MVEAVVEGGDSNEKKHDKSDSETRSGSVVDSSVTNKDKVMHSGGRSRLFGRQKPLYQVLGAGKFADVILWRNKQTSTGILAGGSVIWLLFECIGYHFITFVCHSLILSLATSFLWSNIAFFADMSPPKFPEIVLPEHMFVNVALCLRTEFNRASKIFREVASKNDVKLFLSAIVVLWFISIIGSCFDFLTLLYLGFVMLLTMPMMYEKHEDMVDELAEKALVEIKKQYVVLDEMVLQKLPLPFFNKDHQS